MKNILLDAGHGGADPGAVAADLREADVTLEIALQMANLLRDNYYIFLTRDRGSQYISPSQRLANIKDIHSKVKLDAFVSIHCNASTNPQAHGIETIYRDDNDYLLAAILQRNLLTDTELSDRRCKQDVRQLAVLKAPEEIPACLVEVGFISNPSDHEFIENNISVISESLARGLTEFLGVE